MEYFSQLIYLIAVKINGNKIHKAIKLFLEWRSHNTQAMIDWEAN